MITECKLNTATVFPDATCEAELGQTACVECVLSQPDAAMQGALLQEGSFYRLNIAGCIFNAGREDCAREYERRERCAIASCGTTCADASNNELASCVERARAACDAKYPVKCTNTFLGPDGGAEQCNGGNRFLAAAVTYADLFCSPRDAGLDAAGDALGD